MSGEFKIKVDYGQLPHELINTYRARKDLVLLAAVRAINLAGPFVQRRLAENTPVGATGKARQSVSFEPPRPQGFHQVVGFVGYGAPASLYIGFANDGTRAHFPPITPLTFWAARKLGDASAGFPVARYISRYGTRAQHFVEDTRDEVEGQAVEIMRRAFESFFDVLGG